MSELGLFRSRHYGPIVSLTSGRRLTRGKRW